ncbi:hypothetical protein A2U01_0095741, partial [Trifolium medium]|nr:hypothetical protein [Trifolium medium]
RTTVRFPATAIGRELEPLDAITNLRTRLGGPVDRIFGMLNKFFTWVKVADW